MGEEILSFIGELIGQLFIDGIGHVFRKFYYRITGKQEGFHELARLRRWYLNRNVFLKNDLNELIIKGSKGKVMKIVDENYILVQFEKTNGELIFYRNQSDFKIKRTKVRLIFKKRNKYR